MGNITPEGWGKLRYTRGRDAREKRKPTCATGRRGAAHGGDPVRWYSRASPRCGIDLDKRYRQSGSFELIQTYLERLCISIPLGRVVPPATAKCPVRAVVARLRFFVGRTFRASVKLRNERGPAFDREMDPIYRGDTSAPCRVQSSVLRRIVVA